MSTSAVIIVPGVKVFLYKHFDGYPKATLPWLEAFNHDFTERRGIDPPYKMAQLVRSSVFMAAEFRLDKSCITGWGIVDSSIMGEYIYILNSDGSVTWKRGNIGQIADVSTIESPHRVGPDVGDTSRSAPDKVHSYKTVKEKYDSGQ